MLWSWAIIIASHWDDPLSCLVWRWIKFRALECCIDTPPLKIPHMCVHRCTTHVVVSMITVQTINFNYQCSLSLHVPSRLLAQPLHRRSQSWSSWRGWWQTEPVWSSLLSPPPPLPPPKSSHLCLVLWGHVTASFFLHTCTSICLHTV